MSKHLSALLAALCLLPCLAGCASKAVPPASVDPKTVFKVHAALLNLRECPSATCDVLADLGQGESVSVQSPVMNGWVEVLVPARGLKGYVEARFLAR